MRLADWFLQFLSVSEKKNDFESLTNITPIIPIIYQMSSASSNVEEREILPCHLKFTHYDLDLTPDLEQFTYEGLETVVFYVAQDTKEIQLNGKDLIVNRARIVYDGEVFIPEIVYEKEVVRFVLQHDLTPRVGVHGTLQIQFTGTLNDQLCGFYRTKYTLPDGTEKYAGTTQFESHDARRAFFCADEPGKKGTFAVTLNVPKDLIALSNTPVVSSKECVWDSTKKTVQFRTTPVMSSYLVAWYVGELECVETTCKQPLSGKETLVKTYTTPGKKERAVYANDYAAKILEYFADYFNIDYPLPKLDQIAVPDFSAGAMENWGLVTYRETYILHTESTSAFQEMQIAATIAHELAHQWFGNLVTPEWWNDLWLKEGFATYIGWMAVDHFNPEWKCWEYFVAERYQRALGLDELESSHPINNNVKKVDEIDEIFDTISYLKGASMLRMLAQWLGEFDFQLGLRSYLQKFQYQNAITDDLWEHLSNASNKNVGEMMDSWINQKGYPLVTVSKNRFNQYLFSQQPYGGNPTDRRTWKIPLNLSWKIRDPALKDIVLEENWSCVGIEEGQELIKANMGRSGFFRTLYDPSLDEYLMKCVRDCKFDSLDRSEIFASMFDLAKRGYDDTTRALRFIECYQQEPDYLVWSELIERLNTLKYVWKSHPIVKQRINQFLVDALKGHLQELGWDFKPQDTYQSMKMRQLVISTLAGIGEPTVLNTCRKVFAKFVNNPEEPDNQSLNPNIRLSVFVSVIRFSETAEEIKQLREVFSRVQSPAIKVEILKAIGSAKDKESLFESFDFVFKSGYVRNQDMDYVLLSLDDNAHMLAWEYVTTNWENIKETLGPNGVGGGMLYCVVCAPLSGMIDPKEREQASEFLEQHEKDTKSIRNGIRQVIEKREKLYEWLKRDEQQVTDWASNWVWQPKEIDSNGANNTNVVSAVSAVEQPDTKNVEVNEDLPEATTATTEIPEEVPEDANPQESVCPEYIDCSET